MQSVETAVQRGFSGPVVDTGGALALSQARGVDAETAAILIGFAAEGVNQGYVIGQEGS